MFPYVSLNASVSISHQLHPHRLSKVRMEVCNSPMRKSGSRMLKRSVWAEPDICFYVPDKQMSGTSRIFPAETCGADQEPQEDCKRGWKMNLKTKRQRMDESNDSPRRLQHNSTRCLPQTHLTKRESERKPEKQKETCLRSEPNNMKASIIGVHLLPRLPNRQHISALHRAFAFFKTMVTEPERAEGERRLLHSMSLRINWTVFLVL